MTLYIFHDIFDDIFDDILLLKNNYFLCVQME